MKVPVYGKGNVVVAHAVVDDGDYDLVQGYRWNLGGEHSQYAVTGTGRGAKGKLIYMHRLITGFPPSGIDHENGNKLDNRRSNLRPATQWQNVPNAGPRSNNKTGYKGVSFFRARGKYQATISAGGKTIYLGLFFDPAEAARAYDRKALELFREFARTNFPREEYAI